MSFFFFNTDFIYLFIYLWLCWVLAVARGIFCCSSTRALRCGVWASLQLQHIDFSLVVTCRLCSCGTWAPEHMGSVVVACGLSICSVQAQLPHGICDLISPNRDRTHVPCIGRKILNHWTTREVPINMDVFLFICVFFNFFQQCPVVFSVQVFAFLVKFIPTYFIFFDANCKWDCLLNFYLILFIVSVQKCK